MTPVLKDAWHRARESFWLIPAAMVAAGVLGAIVLLRMDRVQAYPGWLVEGHWLYDGSGNGARTLLAAVASSAIAVAGTVFSITIAALSLAAGQMGPRLLRNFTQDRGNQLTLGAFLGTFSYTLMVLRSVRTMDEGEFVPHLALSVGIVLAFVCVGVLVYFVGHMATRINVDTVIGLVGGEVRSAIDRLGLPERPPDIAPPTLGPDARLIHDPRRGYVVRLDGPALAARLAEGGHVVRLLKRPGDYVFPGAPIAVASGGGDRRGADADDDIAAAIRATVALGPERASDDDLEYAIRQLVEVGLRALSTGVNDPNTALGVLDRLGAALCDLAPLHLPDGRYAHGGRCVLSVPAIGYDGLVDAMFHPIRQNTHGDAMVLIHALEVLAGVAGCERDPSRLSALARHADLILEAGEREIAMPVDLDDLRRRHAAFVAVREHGPLEALTSDAA